ncbi:MAG: SpoVG family protein [Oscillospiraceae bacterium]|nr:SpoVG family protein [Oscillospiraceae bacterium]
MKGIASVNFDECFAVAGIRVMNSDKGLFVAMPSQKVGKEYKAVAFPITKEFREELFGVVLDAYQQKMEEKQDHEKEQKQQEEQKIDDPTEESAHEFAADTTAEETSDFVPEDSQEVVDIDESAGMNMDGM